MGHGGYTLELSLKDSVSAGLKDMGRALSNVRELVALLRADVSALNKASGQAVSGPDLGKLAEGAAERMEGLSRGALRELDAAFRDSGKVMADYYAERRRQAGETADMERENASEQAERMAQELEARKDAYQPSWKLLRRMGGAGLRSGGRRRIGKCPSRLSRRSARRRSTPSGLKGRCRWPAAWRTP